MKQKQVAKEIRDQTRDHISKLRENGVSETNIRGCEHSPGTYEPTENFHKVFSRIIGERRAAHSELDICKREEKGNESEGGAPKSEGAQGDAKTSYIADNNVHPSGQSGVREPDDGEASVDRIQHVSVFERLSGAKNGQRG